MNEELTAAASPFQLSVLELVENPAIDGLWVEGLATESFWSLWNSRKGLVKGAGFELAKGDRGWKVMIRVKHLDTEMTEEEAAEVATRRADNEAFWNSPEGRAAFGQGCR